MPLHFKGLRAT